MSTGTNYWRPIAFGGALVLAVGLGFFIARQSAAPPATAPSAAAVTAEPNEVKVDASYLAVVGIATEPAALGNLTTEVLAPATVMAAPNGEGVVTAHAAGTIVRLFKQLGDSVRAGDTLALIESREVAALTADQSTAESKAALARSSLAREQDLYNQRVTPRQDLERAQGELAVAEAEVRRSKEAAAAAHVTPDGRISVATPLAGKITSATATLGAFVQPEMELFRITDSNFIQVEAAVTTRDAQRVAIGDSAKVTTPTGKILSATVRSVSPVVNEQTRAATVVLSLTEPHESLSPGQIVQANISPRNAAPSGIVVPEDAVQNVGGRSVVFVRTADGFKVQPVVVGSRSAGRVSIISGVDAGQTIATTNAFFLKAELGKGAGEEE
jgi:cobalt-zinc-cadmium efflux system membrane fusion protein